MSVESSLVWSGLWSGLWPLLVLGVPRKARAEQIWGQFVNCSGGGKFRATFQHRQAEPNILVRPGITNVNVIHVSLNGVGRGCGL